MGIVCNRINAGNMGRSPKLFGQLFYGDERFPREYGAALRCDGNKHSIGNSVGVFQLIERDNVWVILFPAYP